MSRVGSPILSASGQPLRGIRSGASSVFARETPAMIATVFRLRGRRGGILCGHYAGVEDSLVVGCAMRRRSVPSSYACSGPVGGSQRRLEHVEPQPHERAKAFQEL